ncbi:uracil-DNA glycosylase [Aneurinibacillus sp. Ricciae_BoGa-3]|uniref:uracil-DNA glycosylase n=1 Tax=Aneurinibacillus sp. Ricciae_BoGa-3 TaxID=3022697 RepID=UPI002341BC1F|nr:uracil-DNA glycosylase [Aneurinibacillus sp. Ricciae_BoGa-3]WCK55365.1 uracil-DNA glycosylase [Aneurinibacillus sp. Ricciae_BoGa-3]
MILPDEFLTCVRCEDGLKREEGQTPVPGAGRLDAKVMLIGESAGAEEMKSALPFQGKAGENLNAFLTSVGLNRDRMYIGNTTRCRPYKEKQTILKNGSVRITKSNKPPSAQAIKACAIWLDYEIEMLNPKLIVTLGSIPLKRLTGDQAISAVHGTLLTTPIQQMTKEGRYTLSQQPYHIFPLYHPASIIYRQELKQVFEQDLQNLRETIDNLSITSVLL